jgi:predicted small secreted protein
MNKIILCLSVVVVAFTLSACGNTMHGAGRDMERMGQSIQNTF